MQNKNSEDTRDAFYLTRWFACLPLLVMVVPAIALSLRGVLSADVMIAGGVAGLMLGSLFARRKKEYWGHVTRSLGDSTGLLVFALFLLVGIYGKLLGEARLAEGLIWLSGHLQVGPALFALFIYVACSVLGTAMGTSVGIVLIMTPVIYPAAVALGVHPVIAAGAILSGAATGDHFAPVSDTTIISSSTQHYKFQKRCAEVGEVVRARMIYVIPAFLISCALYFLAGSFSARPALETGSALISGASPRGLIMLLPMVVVICTALSGRSVFEALTYGCLSAIALGVGSGLLSWEQLFYIDGRELKGVITEGAVQNLPTIVLIVLMMGAYGVMRVHGVLDSLVNGIKRYTGDSARSTELSMVGIATLLNFLLVGLVARVTVVAGPIFNQLGQAQNLHPNRRANLLDGMANSFSFVIPWHVWPMLMLVTIGPLLEQYAFLSAPAPLDFLYSTFYPLAIWGVMLVAAVTGFGRTYESADSAQPVCEPALVTQSAFSDPDMRNAAVSAANSPKRSG
ncbi:Na+/H+ antiporter NhaC family protein [Microbulbifer sp. SA54]|uniref:Na+/H+ antiporter NhaC family protein n=1 Tax=Microbulbifer sp. SA54 TaxID=3401577 RepID=UPI003AB0317D